MNSKRLLIQACHDHARATLNHYRRTLTTLDSVGDFDPAIFHALCERIEIAPSDKATVIWKDGTITPEQ